MTLNKYLKFGLLLLLALLVGCKAYDLEKQSRTVYVAEDYLIFNDHRFEQMSDFPLILGCDKKVDLYIAPLFSTSKQRFTEVMADFLTLCGQPKSITLEFQDAMPKN